MLMSRPVLAFSVMALATLSGTASAEETVTRLSSTFLNGFGSLEAGLGARVTTSAISPSYSIDENTAASGDQLALQPAASSTKKTFRDRMRIELQTSAVYGVFSGNSAPSSERATNDGVVGVGIETPLNRGLALNFEVFQHISKAKRSGAPEDHTKAALKLHFRF